MDMTPVIKESSVERTCFPKHVTILGSTGSVGTNTVELIRGYPERFVVESLVGYRNVSLLIEQALALHPRLVAIGDETYLTRLQAALKGTDIQVAGGRSGILEAASLPADWVMSALVGAVGLEPTLTALRRGATVAFVNKECLVCAGALMMEEAQKNGATLLPVDSEHNALFQILRGESHDHHIQKLILTASGGPFRTADPHTMATATPEQTVQHPVWNMGKKISVDSATMMNKTLEVIEAYYLFGLSHKFIEVVVHPQSIIHGMVEYKDGSVLAALSTPDMRIPIAYALAWPERMETPVPRLNFTALTQMTFEPPDVQRFPALLLAQQVLESGGSAPTILNAANEVSVQAFLEHRIGFLNIVTYVSETLSKIPHTPVRSLDDIRFIDAQARQITEDSLPS